MARFLENRAMVVPLRWSRELLGLLLLCSAAASSADQYQMAADNARVECKASRRELTRISLIGDQFASLNKIAAGTPYNDFSVAHEPVRGDIYLSVPEGFAPRTLSFFATSKKGYVYKFVCSVSDTEAQQVFVTNPAIATGEAAAWENETPLQTTAVRLIRAMANLETVDGYAVRQTAGPTDSVGTLSTRLMAEYRGARLVGKSVRVTNRGNVPVSLTEDQVAPRGTLAVMIETPELAPGAATMVYVVEQNGASK